MYSIERLFEHPSDSGVLICAEIGINHLGSLAEARKMVIRAKDCGADAVKFQVFSADLFYHPSLAPEGYQIFKSLELSRQAFSELKALCDSLDILFYATPFDSTALDFLIDLGCPVVKVASSDITNEPFLKEIADKSQIAHYGTILSTGFVGIDRIRKAVQIFQDRKIAIQYCVSKYPAEDEDFDMNFIQTLQRQFFMPIGFSDHSLSVFLSLTAVSLGAKIIERHFTLDRNLPGGDNAISLDPFRFAEMAKGIRDIERAMGKGVKKITDFEKKVTNASMREMYAARSIRKGEIIHEKDILLLRPGNGVTLSQYKKVIGKKSKKDFDPYEKISTAH